MNRKNDRLYHVYCGMKQRCYSEKNPSYKFYHEKGITVCDKWLSDYESFRSWALNNGYDYSKSRKEQSLDRIDNFKGYSPDNCRFVTHSENCKNTTRNVFLTHNGKTMVLNDWSKETGIPIETLRRRMSKTADSERILCSERNSFRSNTGIKGISFDKKNNRYTFYWKHKYIGVRKTLEEILSLREEYLSGIKQ